MQDDLSATFHCFPDPNVSALLQLLFHFSFRRKSRDLLLRLTNMLYLIEAEFVRNPNLSRRFGILQRIPYLQHIFARLENITRFLFRKRSQRIQREADFDFLFVSGG